MATAKKSAAGAKKAAAKKSSAKTATKAGSKTAARGAAAKSAAKKAPAKKAAAKAPAAKQAPAAKKATATKAPAAKKAAADGAPKKRALNPALSAPMQPSADLAAVIGNKPMPRSEVAKQLWVYIKKHGLQDQTNKRNINADDNLKKVFGGKAQVSMFDMTKLVSQHLKPAS